MDHLYAVIEGCLNEKFFSSKYNSKTQVFPRPYVIVFANEAPKLYDEKGKLTLSEDRWKITQFVKNHVKTFIQRGAGLLILARRGCCSCMWGHSLLDLKFAHPACLSRTGPTGVTAPSIEPQVRPAVTMTSTIEPTIEVSDTLSWV